MEIRKGFYRHFKGNEYEVVGIAHHSETVEDMVVYRACYGDRELWVRPASMWNDTVVRDGVEYRRFSPIPSDTDFRVNIAHDGDARILQLTDMQIIDATQQRSPDRLLPEQVKCWQPEAAVQKAYSHIQRLVEIAQPDLIVLTGDLTYGEFDDSGRVQSELIRFMESLEIPWAPVYGNHDNETDRGIQWQNRQYENASYCLFKTGSVFGNGNYTIGLCKNGKEFRRIFMMDSNGCGKLGIQPGFRPTQRNWLKEQSDPDIPGFVCFHIPTTDFADAYIEAGYQQEFDVDRHDFPGYTIGKEVAAQPGDFGRKNEWMPYCADDQRCFSLWKECGIDGVFAGHLHKINTSVNYRGIRLTFGLKTGLYDYHDPDAVGGTLITASEQGAFQVRHLCV